MDDRAREFALLLSEGLDLCVRAKKIDEILSNFKTDPDTGKYDLTRCGTMPLWAQQQYDDDLRAWEEHAKNALIKSGFIS